MPQALPIGFPAPGLLPWIAVDTTPRPTAVSPNAGRNAGGTAITITGNYFRYNQDGSAPTVTLGGVACTSVVVVNYTTITAVTGAYTNTSQTGGSLVDLKVTCAGQTGTLKGAFTYYGGKILSITPAYGNVAGGTSVVIKGFNFVANCQITFGGVAATHIVFHDSNTYSCQTPAHAWGFVDVVITEPA